MSDEFTALLKDEVEAAAKQKAEDEAWQIFENIPFAGGTIELKTRDGQIVNVAENGAIVALRDALTKRLTLKYLRKMIKDLVAGVK